MDVNVPEPTSLETSRGHFHTILAGPADGPVVLLLHGFPELNVSWRHQIPALAAAGYRVVAPNQRGYAGSVDGGSYATADLAADAVAILDAVGAQHAVVVGHDWGGGVAWTVARLFPERVNALVAMNCPPPSVLAWHLRHSRQQLRKSWYMLFFQIPRVPEQWVAKRMPGMLVAGSYVRSAWNRESLAPYAAAFGEPGQLTGPINWYRGAARGRASTTRQPTPISAPTLVIWGVHDSFLGEELISEESLSHVMAPGNRAEVVRIADAGHFVQNEAPEQVTAALLDWLRTPGAPKAHES